MSTRKRGHRLSKPTHGQALVEMALVLPILLILFFAVIEFGRFIFTYEVLNNAVREGTRYAIVHGRDAIYPSGPMGGQPTAFPDPNGDKVVKRVRDFAFTLGLSTDLVVTSPVQYASSSNLRGSTVTVSATYTWRPLIPFPPLPPISISAESTDVIHY